VGAQPGAYVVVPMQQPTPTRFLYEGGLPRGITGPSNAQRAVDLARYYCDPMPRS